jgi:non-specific serine/threonine protein kinase
MVEPLSVPRADRPHALESIRNSPAVQLFVDRAQAVVPDFELTPSNGEALGAICRQLDGLPLAIELAAVHVGVLPAPALLCRLEHRLASLTGGVADLPERQRALRTTLAWSYDLLEPAAQLLFRRLGVFSGGWTLDAAESICAGAALAPEAILDRLHELIDNSLVRQVDARDPTLRPPRFGMLDSLREYAAERLVEAGEVESLGRAHALHYLALVERAVPHSSGPEPDHSVQRVEDDHANLRTALYWAQAAGAWELGLRLANGLTTFWWLRGHYREGVAWLEGLLAGAATAAVEAHPAPAVRARALLGAGLVRVLAERNVANVAVEQGEYDRAEALAEQATRGAQALGLPRDELLAMLMHGRAARERGDADRAITLLERGVGLAVELGYTLGSAFGEALLGLAYQDRGEAAVAAAHADSALAVVQGSAATWPGLVAHVWRGQVAVAQTDWPRAEVEFAAALEIGRECETTWGLPACLEGLAALAIERHDAIRAARLLGAAVTLRASQGAPVPRVEHARQDQLASRVRRVPGVEAFRRAHAEGQTGLPDVPAPTR